MEVVKYVSDLLYSNMYLIKNGDRYIIIDPIAIKLDIDYNKIDYIILTHEHYDHISGTNFWKLISKAKVLCSKICAEHIEDSKKNLSRYYEAFCQLQTWVEAPTTVKNIDFITKADLVFTNMLQLDWNNSKLLLVETPGHSQGSICILINNKILFSGDTLFRDYQTVTGLPGGSKVGWSNITIPFIKTLGKDIHVYPGHFEDFYLCDYKFWEDNDGRI